MNRLQRRVHHSDKVPEPGTSAIAKGLTFERTFMECSKRMKRLVPTLNRRQTVRVDECQVDSSEPEGQSDGMERPSCSSLPEVDQFYTISLDSEEEDDQDRDSNSKGESFSLSTRTKNDDTYHRIARDNINAMVTLPRNVTPGEVQDSYSRSKLSYFYGTLRSTSVCKEKDGSPSPRRSKWLTPFNHFVSLMTTIGDNLDITSYHTA